MKQFVKKNKTTKLKEDRGGIIVEEEMTAETLQLAIDIYREDGNLSEVARLEALKLKLQDFEKSKKTELEIN